MKDLLRDCIKDQDGFVELRWHKKETKGFYAEKGRVESTSIKKRSGVGVRVLMNGTWGFAFTSDPDKSSIQKAITNAQKSAKQSSTFRKDKIQGLASGNFAVGDFPGKGIAELANMSIEEKVALVFETQKNAEGKSSLLQSIGVGYSEIFEEKSIVTTDGVDVSFSLVRPEFRVSAVASKDGEMQVGAESTGVTGGWDCLFRDRKPELFTEAACKTAIDLLSSGFSEGGNATVILSPSIVGLLVHEAIGHTVEADFVLSGSVAKGKIGQRVASDLVTLSDSGHSEFYDGAGGTLPVDDEGILTQNTTIIENGILKSYLHNRETASLFGVAPTGSARAWEYSDQPLIRMRNTYLHPGESSLDEMIANTKDGYYLEGAKNGQADSTGEFMFAAQKAYRIENGKITKLLKGVTVSGLAFEVLNDVDMVSKEFKWDLGSGYCGKGQPAKVDAGGPYVRTKALLGGVKT
ncbi:TldD/PmbA family protein [Leptospira sp. GIMC2001]|uniref:TldD/PmbA family protein n=1 Tax=Leptospira sp. GIMC2001 TaxID=1513297 RepID=UPI0023494579|nr:TldD/PmbA family protein [Leptospira sp. GIMC2001]WCL48030.1 TldD/PmbA family protein [Leptospira sp. GIMC2001]